MIEVFHFCYNRMSDIEYVLFLDVAQFIMNFGVQCYFTNKSSRAGVQWYIIDGKAAFKKSNGIF